MHLAQKIKEEANAVAYRPVQAETLYWLGYILERTGKYNKAESTLYDALGAAAQSKDALLAAKAMVWLVFIVGYHQARQEAGMTLGRDADAMLSVAGGDETIRARLLNNLGILFWRIGCLRQGNGESS